MRIPALSVVLLLLTSLALVAPAQAVDFGVRAGVYEDANEGFVGGELLIGIANPWYFNPNVEYVFVDNGDLITVNADFHYDFDVQAPLFVWAGGGPALIVSDRDRPGRDDDGDTEVGANLLAGVGWQAGAVVPYLQAKVILSDDSQAVLAFGVRF